jgi:hypothetical protein
MKRKEEIVTQAVKEQSQLHQPLEWGAGFISGANWADKTMLDRACEWLENELKETDNKNGYPTVEGLYFVSVKEFIREFRQAMEGGAE